MEMAILIRTVLFVFLFGLAAPARSSGPEGSGLDLPELRAWQDTLSYGQSKEPGMRSGLMIKPLLSQSHAPLSTTYGQWRLGYLNFDSQLLSAPVSLALNAGLVVQNPYFEQYRPGVGLSFSLGGHIAVGDTLSLYGRSTWLPSQHTFDTSDVFPELEFATGIVLRPLSNFSIQAGYRQFSLDHSQNRGDTARYSMQGLFLGTGLYW